MKSLTERSNLINQMQKDNLRKAVEYLENQLEDVIKKIEQKISTDKK